MCHSANEEQSTRVNDLSSFLEQPSCNWEIEGVVIALGTDRAKGKSHLSGAHGAATPWQVHAHRCPVPFASATKSV